MNKINYLFVIEVGNIYAMDFSREYKIKDTLEENSFLLFRALREKDQLPVIIKYVSLKNSEQARQLQHEYELSSKLDPSFTLKPIAFEQSSDTEALIYEDFKGISLYQYLYNHPLDLRRFLTLALAIARAIHKLHGKGIVHKNIKPQNILVNPESQEVKIIDFGIASVLPSEYPQPITNPEQIEGTLPYMSPEQTGRMNRTIDYRTDMYSLGITYYLMITGGLPFQAKDALEWIYNHMVRLPKPPNRVIPGLPQAISDIIMKLLSKLAEDRYQNLDGLINDLEKCITQFNETGNINTFPLGENDYSGKFTISQKIYGRENEIDILLASYERVVKTGLPELIIVSGYSGAGKTALVNELHKPIVKEKGLFISGKFDQNKNEVPYSTMVEALKGLVEVLLTQSEKNIKEWREKIQEALGINGEIITNIIPQIELIIGKQPPVAELPGEESRNRFKLVFEKFISVFAQSQHPLTIFLDDLQWSDIGSLQLIQQLITNAETKNILFIGAYRSNEIYPAHPLSLTLNNIEKAQVSLKKISLSPLSKENLKELISDSLISTPQKVEALSELVYEKSRGNPFFSIQFLISLYNENLLYFDPVLKKWDWKLEEIKSKEYTDNVVDLMLGRIKKLNTEIQELLQVASCIGTKFEKRILKKISTYHEEELVQKLDEPLRQGLIFSYDHTYKFLHDRLREAAYSLIPESLKREIHLRIGRLLAEETKNEFTGDKIFEIVNQLNRALSLVTDKKERKQLQQLNFIAGHKAKASAAYASASIYLRYAYNLITPDGWVTDYNYSYQIGILLAECEYLSGKLQSAEVLFSILLEKSASNPDKARVYRLKTELYQISGRYEEALNAGLDGLKLFNINFPSGEEELKSEIVKKSKQIEQLLSGKAIPDLLHVPDATDPNACAVIGLISEMGSTAYNVKSRYFTLLMLVGTKYILEYGNTEDSSMIYGFYALIRIVLLNDITAAFEFSDLSLKLNDKFNDPLLKGRLLFLNAISINFKRKHFDTGIPIFEHAFKSCLEAGDLLYASYAAFSLVWHHIETEKSIDTIIDISNQYIPFVKNNNIEVIHWMILQYRQMLLSLKGQTQSPVNFSNATFSEEEALEAFGITGYITGIEVHYVLKQITSFTFGMYEECLDYSIKAEKKISYIQFSATESDQLFYYTLSLTALYDKVPYEKRNEYKETIIQKTNKLKVLSDNCPQNFLNRFLLVSAEIARIEENNFEAMHLYEQAIQSAKENGFVFKEAIANELAGKFYKEKGFESIAVNYLKASYVCYRRWGAEGKVRQLEADLPFLRNYRNTDIISGVFAVEQLDLLSIIKASQSISGQIEIESLTKKLMHIVIENAGAQKGILLLMHDHRLHAAAIAQNIQDTINVNFYETTEESISGQIPDTIIQYVSRTKEKVILSNSSISNQFSNDEYLLKNRPLSVACIPILYQSRLTGILYLENNVLIGAFSMEKISVLEILASQSAISIENAFLFRDLNLSRQQLQDIIDNSSAIIYVKMVDGKYLFANRQWTTLFNISREKISGITDYDLLPKGMADIMSANDRKVINSGEPGIFEENLPYNNILHTYIVVKFLLKDPNNKPYAICGIATDITERKQTEEKIRKLNEGLRKRSDELSLSNKELIKINKDLDDFIYTASHDLKVPIANLEGLINILDDPEYNTIEDRVQIKDLMNFSTEQLKKTIKELESISKIQRDVEIEITENRFDDIMQNVSSMLKAQIDASGAKITSDFHHCESITYSEKNLTSIIYNLLSNAIKFRAPGRLPEITIQTTKLNEHTLFSIRDNGLGIPLDKMDKLFNMFKKFHARTEGAGIGLYVVKRLVENAGGWIEVNSKEGVGTEFKVYLKNK